MKNKFLTMLAIYSVLLLVTPSQAAPEIAVVTEPACNGEVIVLTGVGLDPASTRIVAMALGEDDGDFNPQEAHEPAEYLNSLDNRPSLPDIPPVNAFPCEVLGGDSDGCTCGCDVHEDPGLESPSLRQSGPATRRAGVSHTSSTVLKLNGFLQRVPLPVKPSASSVAHSPGVGRSSRPWRTSGKLAAAFPIPLSRAPEHREDGHTERWCLSAWLPKDLDPGQYEVFVHARHGGPWGWSDPLPIAS